MSQKPNLESRFETFLFMSRWLMAPMYAGLVITLAMLTFVFLRDLAYYLPQLMSMKAEQVILVVLTLIDLTLAANLLTIVMFSGYENFVSKFDIPVSGDKPSWMGKVDFAGLKMKLIASIVAISAIHMLKRFMEIGSINPETGLPVRPVNETELYWLAVLHMVFVLSGLLMAAMDWIVSRTSKH